MAATQAESQQNDVNNEQVPPDQRPDSRNTLLQNGTDKNSVRGQVSDSVVNTKGKSPVGADMSQYSGEPPAPGPLGTDKEDPGYAQFPRYHEPGADPYGPYGGRPGKPAMIPPRPPRYLSGQSISQQTGPTPTLNSLLQSHPGAPPPHRYPNSYEQPPYAGQGWAPPPPRPYSPQQMGPAQPYRNPPPNNASRGGQSPYPNPGPGPGPGPGGFPPQGPPQQGPPGGPQYSPYPQRYPTPPGAGAGPNQRPPFPPHQYGEPPQRSGWPPGGPSPAASPGPGLPPPSPQQGPPQSPGHAPSPSPQPPQPSQSPHQTFPNRPSQASTPNTHDADTGDPTGQNSNDSNSGGGGGAAPGTPNSQGMRPTPSPTGSSGSRSMSPAVGQQNIPMPPRPSSSQSDGPTRTPIPMAAQSHQGYSQPPPHMHGGYKMAVHPPAPQNMPPYPPQSQQYPPGNYSPRPQYAPNYGGGPVGQPPPPSNNMGPGPGPGQYPGRPMPNHVQPHGQFPGYQQNWGQSGMTQAPPPSILGNHVSAGKGAQPPPSGGSIRPNYLKTHLHHKLGYIAAPSPQQGPQQGYGPGPGPGPGTNGPGMGPPGAHHPPMAPPHHMGPPMVPPNMGPPASAPPTAPSPSAGTNSHHEGPMPPPTEGPQDNGVSSSGPHPVTSLVTTGPDGASMDEASQQSTLSNASAASGEDPQCSTPKSRKGDSQYSHPMTPASASPGAQQQHDDYDMNSPSWPRTPASPVFNSHVPQETFRSKKSDSLSKLYDMDDCPDRRGWLDKLLGFMEERRTPITACPTISKQPLDLYKLYLLVRERGGFVEVCKVTKNKTWKDIAGMLGIGASSSAAYTLRKHYTKNLLTFECHFDRGGIDPGPIIQQVEAGSKKKGAKAASVPSPVGSSNSQDSFPAPGSSGGASLDGYSGYGSGYPPGSTPDYNSAPMQRPPSQSNAQSPHPGMQQNPPYQGQPGPAPYNQYGAPEQYGPPPPPGPTGQYPPGPPGQFPPNSRPMYPPYGAEGGERGTYNAPPPSGNSTPPTTSGAPPPAPSDPYRPYGTAPNAYPPPRPYTQPPTSAPPATPSGPPAAPPQQPAGPANYPAAPQPDYYRQQPPPPQPDQISQPSVNLSSQLARQLIAPLSPAKSSYHGYGGQPAGAPGSKTMPPPATQPRRHPDFTKEPQQYPPYQNRPQMYGWPNNTGQFRGQYPPQGGPPQQWSGNNRAPGPPGPPGPPQGAPGQWDQHRYPPGAQPPYQPPQQGQQWAPMSTPPGVGQGSPLRPARPQFRPDGKPFSMPPPQGNKAGVQNAVYPSQPPPKRELVFPPDSVEAVQPVLYRRKKICRSDVAPVDAWKIFMALRSGLLAESCWALDVLNVLLYDDSTIPYFGLIHLPGLLDLLLEHFQKSLKDMFDPESEDDDFLCYNFSTIDTKEVDLGGVENNVDPEDRIIMLSSTTNYTDSSRKGLPVKVVPKEEDIFVTDHHKPWDLDGDEQYRTRVAVGIDPWQAGQTDISQKKYIMNCFQAEFANIPFARLIKSVNSDCDINKRTKTNGELSCVIKTEPTNVSESVMDNNEHITVDLSAESRIKEETMECDEIVSEVKRETHCNNNKFDLEIKDPAGTLKRRRMSDYEDECYTRDESSLYLVTESQDSLARRCVCISTILRNLTFVPGNEIEFAKNCTFLSLLGKLLLLHHEHPVRTHKTKNYDREEDADFTDSCSSLQGEGEWWWDFLVNIRENVLVAASNIAGHMDLGNHSEEISRPVLDGLLHWAVCPSAQGQDPFPTVGTSSLLSPQRLALEALCKLCVTDANVDLVIATPPFSRLERLCAVLTRHLCRSEDQVLREFSVNLLHYLAAADSAMSRAVAAQSPCVSLLVAFIEQAEQSALGVANQHGIGALRDNPDSMGTSLDMLRRAAGTLLHLSRHPENRPLFLQQEQRLLGLVMSQILDQQVAAIISRVLYQCSRGPVST